MFFFSCPINFYYVEYKASLRYVQGICADWITYITSIYITCITFGLVVVMYFEVMLWCLGIFLTFSVNSVLKNDTRLRFQSISLLFEMQSIRITDLLCFCFVICFYSFCKRANRNYMKYPRNKVEVKEITMFLLKLGIFK